MRLMNSDLYPLSIKRHRTKRLRKIHKPESVEKEDKCAASANKCLGTNANYHADLSHKRERKTPRKRERGGKSASAAQWSLFIA
jgi:hypothetical protein